MAETLVTTQDQPQEHSYTQQAAEAPTPHSVSFTDMRNSWVDGTVKKTFFQQQKTQKGQITGIQQHSSKNEECFLRKQQQYITNQRK